MKTQPKLKNTPLMSWH